MPVSVLTWTGTSVSTVNVEGAFRAGRFPRETILSPLPSEKSVYSLDEANRLLFRTPEEKRMLEEAETKLDAELLDNIRARNVNPVRGYRILKKMDQRQLAEAAAIKQPNLSRIESGKHQPTLRTLQKIASALGVELRDLIDVR